LEQRPVSAHGHDQGQAHDQMEKTARHKAGFKTSPGLSARTNRERQKALLPRSGTTAAQPRRTAFIRSILLTTEVTEDTEEDKKSNGRERRGYRV
jgi:hypothetical protein